MKSENLDKTLVKEGELMFIKESNIKTLIMTPDGMVEYYTNGKLEETKPFSKLNIERDTKMLMQEGFKLTEVSDAEVEANEDYYKAKIQVVTNFMNDVGISPDTLFDNKDIISDQLEKYDLEMVARAPFLLSIGVKNEYDGVTELGKIYWNNVGIWSCSWDPFILKPVNEAKEVEFNLYNTDSNSFMKKDEVPSYWGYVADKDLDLDKLPDDVEYTLTYELPKCGSKLFLTNRQLTDEERKEFKIRLNSSELTSEELKELFEPKVKKEEDIDRSSVAEQTILDKIKTVNSKYELKDIQLWPTPQGNLNIRTNDGKDICTITGFDDDAMEELRLNGYFDAYDDYNMNKVEEAEEKVDLTQTEQELKDNIEKVDQLQGLKDELDAKVDKLFNESKLNESAYCYELYDNKGNKVDNDSFTDYEQAIERARTYIQENEDIDYVEVEKLIWYNEDDYENYEECDDSQRIKTITRDSIKTEARTNRKLHKGDKFVNPNGVECEIISVDEENLLDGEPQVTYQIGKDYKCYKQSSVNGMLDQNKYTLKEDKEDNKIMPSSTLTSKKLTKQEILDMNQIPVSEEQAKYLTSLDIDEEDIILGLQDLVKQMKYLKKDEPFISIEEYVNEVTKF